MDNKLSRYEVTHITGQEYSRSHKVFRNSFPLYASLFKLKFFKQWDRDRFVVVKSIATFRMGETGCDGIDVDFVAPQLSCHSTGKGHDCALEAT